jgi:hypothetical protein
MKIIIAVKIYKYLIIKAPKLNLSFTCNKEKTTSRIIGIVAGYKLKLSLKLPFINAMALL